MRVATFNIQHGRPAGDGGVDIDTVVDACASLTADVLALQEVDRGVRRSGRNDLAGAVADATGATLLWGRTLRTGGGEYGNALLVRGTAAEILTVALPRPWRSEPRGAVVARLSAGGVDGTVAATHLGVAKSESLIQLRAIVAELMGRPGPRILLGDFNRHPHEVEPELAAAGLRLVPTGLTFPANAPKHRIDYVAVDGLSVLGAAVVRTAISDHRAVVADVAIRSPITPQEGAPHV